MSPHGQPSGREPNGALFYTLPFQDEDLPGVRGDVIKLTYEPYLPPGQRWSGRTELDQCDCMDLTEEEILWARIENGIEENPR